MDITFSGTVQAIDRGLDKVYDFLFTSPISGCSGKGSSKTTTPDLEPISLSRVEIASVMNMKSSSLSECDLDNIPTRSALAPEANDRYMAFFSSIANYIVDTKFLGPYTSETGIDGEPQHTYLRFDVANFADKSIDSQIRDRLVVLAPNQREAVANRLTLALVEAEDDARYPAIVSDKDLYDKYCAARPKKGSGYPDVVFPITRRELLDMIIAVEREITPKHSGQSCDLDGCEDEPIQTNFKGLESLTRRYEILGLLEATMPFFSISNVTPSSGKQGETVAIRVNGTPSNFDDLDTTTLSLSLGSGITISNAAYANGKITATISIGDSASVGARTLTIRLDGHVMGSKKSAFRVTGEASSTPVEVRPTGTERVDTAPAPTIITKNIAAGPNSGRVVGRLRSNGYTCNETPPGSGAYNCQKEGE